MTITKRNPDGDDEAAARATDRETRRAGQQSKMAWVKEVLAATDLGDSAKLVGITAAIHFGYSKGVVRVEHKTLATRCNKTARGIEKAANELARQNYWEVDRTPGRANVYTLIPPDERRKLWDQAERGWRSGCRQWADAERQWEHDCNRWLTAEREFQWLEAETRARDEFVDQFVSVVLDRDADADRDRARTCAVNITWKKRADWNAPMDAVIDSMRSKIRDMEREKFLQQFNLDGYRQFIEAMHEFKIRVYNAVYDRCSNAGHASAISDAAWAAHQDVGLTLERSLQDVAALPQERFPEPDPAPEPAETPTPQGEGPRPQGEGYYTPGVGGGTPQGEGYYTPGVGGPTLPTALNCGDDLATSSSRNASDAELQDARSAPGLTPGRALAQEQEQLIPVDLAAWAAEEAACPLCVDGTVPGVRLIEEDGQEFEFSCFHDADMNERELRESEFGGVRVIRS